MSDGLPFSHAIPQYLSEQPKFDKRIFIEFYENKGFSLFPKPNKDILIACLKSATELYISPFGSEDEEPETFEEICTRVTTAAKKMAEELMRA